MPVTPREAREIQEHLRFRVLRAGAVRPRLVAGADVLERGGIGRGAIVVMRKGEVVEEASSEVPIDFPYVPGLLSFREIPPLLAAFRKLKSRPDVVIVDGQGYAHPRRIGLASHFGVVAGVPTIGSAKSRLIGTYDEPGPGRGSWSPLTDGGETIGAALRTQDRRHVVFVSIGHRITLRAAIKIVLDGATRYRLPEPQRLADKLSRRPAARTG